VPGGAVTDGDEAASHITWRSGVLERLRTEGTEVGKREWRPMLEYTARLHERSVHPPRPPFSRPWEEIGPGYHLAPAFGHWDIAHQILDVLPAEPEHARAQILNNLQNQENDGLIPGSIWMAGNRLQWSREFGHPPVWPAAVEDYCEATGERSLTGQCFEALVRQIGWFERERKAEGIGFYYTDILNHKWESGIDEGVRFDDVATGAYACVDATPHVYLLYDHAARWTAELGRDETEFEAKAAELRAFMQDELFDEETGFFHDIWAVGKPEVRHLPFEGMWPMVVGAATAEQAARVIDENLLSPDRFFATHPIATVALSDPSFELRMWRGPAWNSMTYWAARGCLRYRRREAARQLLEAALDDSAAQFERTGTVWEFYHPMGGKPEELARKPQTKQNTPCRDYLGHNPLIAMARMWEQTRGG
jgi:putative isomerase